ncbi:FeoA family protein [Sphingomonas hengshuiensis]|uniref:Iron transporter FeoA n=1 Tax=Sphingomonas hengshuiensis TaxID=1609977 RepID=A0A7U4JB31_9SPHN|nr:FeoA family protein [Sphingomonas hengshuiensis]AJP73547.1 iron transporter FeoA [Sphingomonas hengshuiensis]
MNAVATSTPLTLARVPRAHIAWVTDVEWHALTPPEARRLRELGLDEGVEVEMLHRSGLLGGGPVACRIGRMTVALRRHVAAAIRVRTAPADAG